MALPCAVICSAVPIDALDKVRISDVYGIIIPSGIGLEMSCTDEFKDSPTSAFGSFRIGPHFVSPVEGLLQRLKAERVDALLE